jgi:hypothetical protein
VWCETAAKHDTKCRHLNFKVRGGNSWSCGNLFGVLSYGADETGFESPQGHMTDCLALRSSPYGPDPPRP